MKKAITILLIILSLQAKASLTGEAIVKTAFVGFCMVPVFDNIWYNSERNSNGLHISTGFDPGILAKEQHLDLRMKFFYHINRFEPSIIGEDYAMIDFNCLSLGLDYMIINRKLCLLSGLEGSRIWNKGKTANSWGWNTELRLLVNDRLSASLIGNLKTRPEISKKVVYSLYFHANFRLTGK